MVLHHLPQPIAIAGAQGVRLAAIIENLKEA